jgi:hypothetical protein
MTRRCFGRKMQAASYTGPRASRRRGAFSSSVRYNSRAMPDLLDTLLSKYPPPKPSGWKTALLWAIVALVVGVGINALMYYLGLNPLHVRDGNW